MTEFNVLSCFDGMSCGQIALNRAGIKYDNYFASEIDKYAIKVTQANYPNTIQLGDITKWQEWRLPKIDLIIGGSPCQGFSFAGKGLNFDDPRSKLFFTFEDILKSLLPRYWLLENVKMLRKHEVVITDRLKCNPVEINSSLVSAQNRLRLYWTNIGNPNEVRDFFGNLVSFIQQPKDKGLILQDILEDGFNSDEKSYTIDSNYQKTSLTSLDRYVRKSARQVVFLDRINSSQDGKIVSTNGKSYTRHNNYPKILQRPKLVQVSSVYENNADAGRVYSTNGLARTLKGEAGGMGGKTGLYSGDNGLTWRKLTPIECERLQTVEENFTNYVSNSQRYKMLGNGWTVDVISHIFSYLRKDLKNGR
jgi:DNA-cytosine methyltransferase